MGHLLPSLAPSTPHMCSTQDCESGDHRHRRCCLPRHPRPRVLLLPSLLLPSQETDKRRSSSASTTCARRPGSCRLEDSSSTAWRLPDAPTWRLSTTSRRLSTSSRRLSTSSRAAADGSPCLPC